jgi:hypothetical protein
MFLAGPDWQCFSGPDVSRSGQGSAQAAFPVGSGKRTGRSRV